SRERKDRNRTRPRLRVEDKQIKRGDIPQRREAAKIVVGGFHQSVGEIESAGDDNQQTERNRRRLWQQSARRQSIGRHKNIIEDIDDEIEDVARPARQQLGDL